MEDSSQVKHKHLVLVTTVPQTLSTILRGQPGFLGEHFALTLVTSPDGSCEEIAAREGVPVQTVSMRRGISPLHDLLSLVRMIWLLLKLRPDAIHSYTPKAGLIAMLAGFICRVPVRIHTFTGLIFPTASGFRQRLLIQIDRLICACATRVQVGRMLCLGVFFNALASMFYALLHARAQVRSTALLHLLELPLFVLALLLLIPPLGVLGAATAWMLRVLLDCMVLAFWGVRELSAR